MRLLEVSAIAHIICDAGVTPRRVETVLTRVSSSTLIDVLCGTIDAKGEASGGALLEYLGAYTFYFKKTASSASLSLTHTYTRNSMCSLSVCSILFSVETDLRSGGAATAVRPHLFPLHASLASWLSQPIAESSDVRFDIFIVVLILQIL